MSTGSNHGRDRVPEPLTALAEQLADEVLADAVPEARRRARDRLVDLLADAIVESATSGRRPPSAAPVTGTDPDHDGGRVRQALYVYAVTRASDVAPDVVGVDGSRVAAVEHRDLALLVSDIVPDLLEGLDREPVTEDGRLATLARRHDAVVGAAFEQGPVLPLRFGTVVHDEPAARQLLTTRYATLDDQLGRLSGHAEYGVRVVEAPGGEEPGPTGSLADAAQHPDSDDRGTTYLSRRRDELAAREQRRRRLADVLSRTHDQLGDHALESVRNSRAPHEGVLSEAAYLVADGRKSEFLAAAERASTEMAACDLDLSVQGPLPPYSFARVELDSEVAHG